MRRYSERHGMTTVSEINITPLLDLAFVLLIIFMITTPLFESSTSLVVPSSTASKDAVDPAQVQTLSIDRDEVLEFNGDVLTADELRGRLAELKESNPDLAVVIRAHKDLPVQKLVSLMDVLQQTGITKVGIVTTTEPQGNE